MVEGKGDSKVGDADCGFFLGEPLGEGHGSRFGDFLRLLPGARFRLLSFFECFSLLGGVKGKEGRMCDVAFCWWREVREKLGEGVGCAGPKVVGCCGSCRVNGQEALGHSFAERLQAAAMGEANPGRGDGTLLARFGKKVSGEGFAEEVIEGEAGVGDFGIKPTEIGGEGAAGRHGAGTREQEETGFEGIGEALLLQHAVDEGAARWLLGLIVGELGGGGLAAKEGAGEEGELLVGDRFGGRK